MLSCNNCGRTFTRKGKLIRHLKSACPHNPVRATNQCPACDYNSPRKDTLKRHLRQAHGVDEEVPEKRPKVDENKPSTADPNIEKEAEEPDDDEIINLIQLHRDRIRTRNVRSGKHQDLYNFELNSATNDEIETFLGDIVSSQKNPFKFNASLGFILQNFLTRQLIYYYASTNNRLFDKPILIKKASDVHKFSEQIGNVDLMEHCKQQRQNSKFVVRKITNVMFYVDKIKSHTMGCPCKLPDYTARKQSIFFVA